MLKGTKSVQELGSCEQIEAADEHGGVHDGSRWRAGAQVLIQNLGLRDRVAHNFQIGLCCCRTATATACCGDSNSNNRQRQWQVAEAGGRWQRQVAVAGGSGRGRWQWQRQVAVAGGSGRWQWQVAEAEPDLR